ncbi:mitochondrial carrier domain-containing protein [Entophlyctis helioformis]|nr:mitochondrial carrier domain-containing protein [Entophlyctis helioformis]
MSASAAASASAPAPAKKSKNVGFHLFSGGVAGCCEALTCHPLDTIKVRLQLRGERAGVVKRPPAAAAGTAGAQALNAAAAEAVKPKRQSFIGVGVQIVQKEGFLSLYKGLGAVVSGIVPKMAIRFSSFEYYKELLGGKDGKKPSSAAIFLAGLGAGTTESVLVVTPMDVIKIRLQAQRHSMTDPLDIPKYRNAAHCAYVMIREEGVASLYKGVFLTVLRQSTNQAANFTVYEFLKKKLADLQPDLTTLPPWQTLIMGFISGACGPLFNAPIDTIKTRIQKNPSKESGWTRFINISTGIIKNEGYTAFYKGLTPRVLRVAPGQAIVFMVYERVYAWCMTLSQTLKVDEIEKAGLNGTDPNANEN